MYMYFFQSNLLSIQAIFKPLTVIKYFCINKVHIDDIRNIKVQNYKINSLGF